MYKDYSPKFRKNLSDSIENIQGVDFIDKYIVDGDVRQLYACVVYSPEPQELKRIAESIRNATDAMKKL